MIPPQMMCDKHLLGEHLELHMFVGCIEKGKSIEGYIQNGLVEVHHIRTRHDEIVKEMLARGMNHNTPISNSYKLKLIAGKVDVEKNGVELMTRCLLCRCKAQEITNLRK